MPTLVRPEIRPPSLVMQRETVHTAAVPGGPGDRNRYPREFRFPEPIPFVTLKFQNHGHVKPFEGKVHVTGVAQRSQLSDTMVNVIEQTVTHEASSANFLAEHGQGRDRGFVDRLVQKRRVDDDAVAPMEVLNHLYAVDGRQPNRYSMATTIQGGRIYDIYIGWLTPEQGNDQHEAVVRIYEKSLQNELALIPKVFNRTERRAQLLAQEQMITDTSYLADIIQIDGRQNPSTIDRVVHAVLDPFASKQPVRRKLVEFDADQTVRKYRKAYQRREKRSHSR